MTKSMTGFGRGSFQFSGKMITIEIRSLNSKGFDLSLQLSQIFKEKEGELRNFLASSLSRGKVDFKMFVEQDAGEEAHRINETVFRAYAGQIKIIAPELQPNEVYKLAFALPDVTKAEKAQLDETLWQECLAATGGVCKHFDEFRTTEGKKLAEELVRYVSNIEGLLSRVPEFEKQRIVSVRGRLEKAFEELKTDVDKNRFEQELIYYLEKLDISEEKVRLKSHMDYFLHTLKSENESGKKLGFIAQEMGREINTLGSKANNAELQKIVIQMKDELEKIKEQSLNVL